MLKEVIEELEDASQILIYGAAYNASVAVIDIDILYPDKLIGVAVTEKGDQPNYLYEYPIKEIQEYETVDKEETVVIVAVRPLYFNEILSTLKSYGYEKIYCLGEDDDLMTELNELAAQKGRFLGLDFHNVYELINLRKLSMMKKVAERLRKEN